MYVCVSSSDRNHEEWIWAAVSAAANGPPEYEEVTCSHLISFCQCLVIQHSLCKGIQFLFQFINEEYLVKMTSCCYQFTPTQLFNIAKLFRILSILFLYCICKDMSCRRPQQDRRTTSQHGRSAWTTRWLNWSTRRCVSRTWSSCHSTEATAGKSTTSRWPENISARHSLCRPFDHHISSRFFHLQQLGLHDWNRSEGASETQVTQPQDARFQRDVLKLVSGINSVVLSVCRKQIQDLNWQRKNDQLSGGAKLRELESK